MGAVPLENRADPIAEVPQAGVPRHALECAIRLAQHGMNHAGGMIGNLQKPRALRADETLADRMRSVGNNRGQLAIAIGLDQDSAVRLADSAERATNVEGAPDLRHAVGLFPSIDSRRAIARRER